MKKLLSLLLIGITMQFSLNAQDFVLNNPIMSPNPAVFPGGLQTISFDFYVAGAAYTFSSNDISNDYATITFSFTKMNPTLTPPTGSGAALFTWVLTNNGGIGSGLVFTWTGRSRDVLVNQTPPQPKYKIIFAGVPVTIAATQAQTDIRVAGQFTDPGNAPTGNAGNNSAVIATYTTPGGPQPILLLDFDAVKQGSTAQLNWHTSSEINSDHFEIEWSKDGSNWQTLGNVVAAGNSSTTRSYGYNHATPVTGTNYYRLRQVDIGGAFVYSPVRIVNFDTRGGIKILPNPVVDRLYILSGQITPFQSVSVYNVSGIRLQETGRFVPGNSIDLSRYPAGTYFIKITDANGNIETHSVVKGTLK
ncbi:MAG TPA: T9SS type A sorting domain-containing protein [Ferruginibacter sp.]|nr:T9SS type A sorting domain-containing protein [Ferruginibacter sp.]